MKECTKCLKLKEITEFNKDSKRKSGIRPQCKECVSAIAKSYYNNNKDKLIIQTNEYYLKNKENRKIKRKEYNQKNKKRINETSKEYYYKNKDKFKSYYSINKEKINNYNVQYRIERYKKDVDYKLICVLRGRLTDAIKGNFKTGSALKDLGCSIDELKLYLESKFQEGMNWNNHGVHGWHIDHIKPLSKFDLTDEVQLKEAVHYTNLQPLWAEDNLKKGNKILTTCNDNDSIPTVSSDIIIEAANEDCQFLTSETDHG